MKSIRNRLAGSVLAGGVLLAAGFSVAGAADDATAPASAPSAVHGPDFHRWGPEHLYSKLNLTPEQQASIKAIFTATKPQMQTMHAQMKASHLKMTQTKPDDPNYGNVVAEVAQTNATLASQRTTQMAEVRAQIYALLTPAQKAQLATLETQRAANPHHGHWGQRDGAAPAGAPAPTT